MRRTEADRKTKAPGSTTRRPSRAPARAKERLAWGELAQLAGRLGVSPGHLSRHLRGERPSASLAARIRALTGRDPAALEPTPGRQHREAAPEAGRRARGHARSAA